MAYFLLGFLVLIAVLLLSRWVARTDPARLVKIVRWALIVAVAAGLVGVVWAGRYLLAAYVLPFLIPVLIRGGLAGLGRQKGRQGPQGGAGERARPSSAMSRDDAYAILGLAPGASETAIREAHRRLMAKVHPDRGGSDYLAAQINQARDLLLG